VTAIIIAAAATSTATAAGAAIDLGARFIDIQGTPAKLSAIQCLNRLFRLATITHFHKAEPAGAPGGAIRDHRYAVNCAVWFKQRAQVLFRGAERKISYKKLHFFRSFGEF
jgi:hypothetical protein